MNSETLYSISEEDFQQVAQDVLDRNLSPAELQSVLAVVEKQIDWHGIIQDALLSLNHQTNP